MDRDLTPDVDNESGAPDGPRAGLTALQPDLCKLHQAGAHLVLCRGDKRAVARAWQKTSAALEEVVAHASTKNHLIGLIPASLGMCVIDVDGGDYNDVVQVLGPPLVAVPTQRSGGVHLYYRRPDGKVGNSKWSCGSASGEIRCDAGYVILWRAGMVAEAQPRVHRQQKVDLTRLTGRADPPAPPAGSDRDKVTRTGKRRAGKTPPRWMIDGALAALDPADYDPWIDTGLALYNTLGPDKGWQIWSQWSARSDKWDEVEGRKKWQSFGGSPRADQDTITMGSVFKRAKDAGWTPRDAAAASELDLALRLAREQGDDYRHCEGVGWHKWLGTHWDHKGARGAAFRAMCSLVREYSSDSKRELRAIQRNGFVGGALALATVQDPLYAPPNEWDDNGQDLLLNVRNGTLDLQSMILHDHRREDLLTAVSPVNWTNPTAEANLIWHKFIERFLPLPEERDLVCQFIGYSLTGWAMDDHFLMIVGDRGSGKSTFITAVLNVLGSHACRFSPKVILEGGHLHHETALMQFRGKRLAVCPELPRNARVETATLNMLTGDDEITGRLMRQDHVTYRRTAKLMLLGNHRPSFGDSTGDGIVRRLLLLEAPREIPEDQQDPELGERLLQPDVQSAILNWAVTKGLRQFVANGHRLTIPKTVRDRNATAFDEDDPLSAFLAANVRQAAGAVIPVDEIYARYRNHCERNGIRYQQTKRKLAQDLIKRGWERPRTARLRSGPQVGRSVRCWHGWELIADSDDRVVNSVDPAVPVSDLVDPGGWDSDGRSREYSQEMPF